MKSEIKKKVVLKEGDIPIAAAAVLAQPKVALACRFDMDFAMMILTFCEELEELILAVNDEIKGNEVAS